MKAKQVVHTHVHPDDRTDAEEEIWVYLCNLEPTDMLEYGHVLPQPGEEADWFNRLPKPLRDYLAQLGTTKDTFTL